MAQKKKPLPDNESPPFWAVRYLMAVADGKEEEAKAAQDRLLKLGFIIRPASEVSA